MINNFKCEICGKPSKHADTWFLWFPCEDHEYLTPNQYRDEVERKKKRGPCAKQVVRATLVDVDGNFYVGENDCNTPQKACPRAPGEDYTKCKTVCNQTGHAESNVIKLAGKKAKGGTIYLEGHTYACEACQKAMKYAGVIGICFSPPPANLSLSNLYQHLLDKQTTLGPEMEKIWEENLSDLYEKDV